MFRKLIHHRPFFRKPPFEDPRELGERYPKEPILEDYWIKPYILEALKNYPRLNDSCVVEGLWTFANSILLKNYKAVKRVPPTFDDPEVTHKIAFLDKEDVELGAIKFWRKVDSTFGIDVKLGNGGISIVGDNDNPTMSLVNTPVNDGPKEIVNVEYLNQALAPFNDALDALANRVKALEDLYDDHISAIVTDPNGNYRDVHTTIHADVSDANLPTCGAVYQYGKGISDALNNRIDGLPTHNDVQNAIQGAVGSLALPIASKNNRGIMQVGNGLTVDNGLVSIDTDTILGLIGVNLNTSSSSSGSGGNVLYLTGTVRDVAMRPTPIDTSIYRYIKYIMIQTSGGWGGCSGGSSGKGAYFIAYCLNTYPVISQAEADEINAAMDSWYANIDWQIAHSSDNIDSEHVSAGA